MKRVRLKKSEVNHIKSSLNRCSTQGLANELGRAKETVKGKIREIKESERIKNLCNNAKRKLKRGV